MQSRDRILYLECGTGISGDMTVAALLDLGADQEKLLRVLKGIPRHGFEVRISRVKKAAIDCCDFDVVLDKEHDGHDHDMEYLYGHLEEEQHGQSNDHHAHDHHHDHEHDHDHHHYHGHDHHHHHTGMKEIREIIGGLDMTDSARALALRIFEILAQAESEAHGVPADEVHFHEVGAIDSIVDIVAAAVCFDDLGIGKVAVTGIAEGSGTVRCQHGILQVPVPAVASIARTYKLPIRYTGRQGELVTPTGAAIVAALMTQDTLPETFVIEKTGLGAGKREYEIPSILRAMVIESRDDMRKTASAADSVWKLECDIDDSTGEQLGYALEKLFEAGAREAHYSPVYMKKNRPGWELTVICDEAHLQKMEEVIFTQTTTIGIRRQEMARTVLTRKVVNVQTRYGEIPVKVSGEGQFRRVHPEYEKVSEAATKFGAAFGAVYDEVLTNAYRNDDIS